MHGWATAVRSRTLVALLGGNFVSSMGTHVQQSVVAWLLYRETGSSTLVGLLLVALQAPVLLLTVPAGLVADHHDRRRFLLGVQTTMMGAAVVLAVMVGLDLASAPWLIGLTLVVGAGNAVLGPAWIAELGNHVPPDAVYAAYSLNSVSFHGSVMLGPPLGAFLLTFTGPLFPIVLNAVSFAAVCAAIAGLPRVARLTTERLQIRRALGEATAFARRSDRARRLMPLSGAVALISGGVPAVLPAFAATVLGQGAGGYGQLLGAMGAGSLCGAIALGLIPPGTSRRRVMEAATWTTAGGVGLLSVASSMLPAMLAMSLIGGGSLTLLVMARTVVQLDAPDELKGRAISVWFTAAFAATPVGSLAMGWAADQVGPARVISIASAYAVLVAVCATVGSRGRKGVVIPFDELAPV